MVKKLSSASAARSARNKKAAARAYVAVADKQKKPVPASVRAMAGTKWSSGARQS